MTQLSLFSYQPSSDEDYPILVAEKWQFDLSSIVIDGARYYHASQWVSGLGAKDKSAWSKIKKQVLNSNQDLEIKLLPHQTRGGIFDVDFISEQSCYIVAQSMRVTKGNPQLKEIQDYLAKSGCFVNWARQNPDEAIEILKPLAQIKREKQIKLHEQWALDDTPESRHYQARHENIETYKLLQSVIARVCHNPQVGILTNAEYVALFGETTDGLKKLLNTKSIRDSLNTRQIRTLTFAEDMLRDTLVEQHTLTNDGIIRIIDDILPPIGAMLKEIMNSQGLDHITSQPLLGGE